MNQETEQHPISLYLKVWGLLFVLSTFSYLVDYFHVQGYTRWSLIIIFMLLKAGAILSIFMHVSWEQLSLKLVLFVPPISIVIFVIMMAIESDYVVLNRLFSFIQS